MLLAPKPNLFAIGTIIIPDLKILAVMATNAKISIDAKTDIDAKINTNTNTNTNVKISTNKPIFDFLHTLGKNLVDIMPVWIKMQDMKMAKWNLLEEVQICPLNLGIHNKP